MIQLRLSKNQVLAHAEECVAMVPNATVRSNLMIEIQRLIYRFDDHDIQILKEEYETRPNTKTALALGALFEEHYHFSNPSPGGKQSNRTSAAYWHTLGLFKAFTSRSTDEFKLETLEKARLFLKQHPHEAKVAINAIISAHEFSPEIQKRLKQEGIEGLIAAKMKHNHYRLMGQLTPISKESKDYEGPKPQP